MMRRNAHAMFLSLACSLTCLAQTSEPLDLKPRLFLTCADLLTLRQQQSNPTLAMAYQSLREKSQSLQHRWRKSYPASTTPRSTQALLEIGRAQSPSRDYKTLAMSYALTRDPETATVLREKLMAAIGARQVHNYWRNDGIHESETAVQFLEAADIADAAGLFIDSDRQVIAQEMARCGHFLEGWTLDNEFSQGYADYFRKAYCLNFHVFAATTIGIIAMRWPELPDSPRWLNIAQTQLPRVLLSEFAPDGAYGEGSIHYWHPTFRAILQFMVVSRNLGVRDYFTDPSITDALRQTLMWRAELTAPDARLVAVGDSDRETLGAEYLLQGGKILNCPELVGAGRWILARQSMFPTEPYDLVYNQLDVPAQTPTATYSNRDRSGYSTFRSGHSGWKAEDNFLFFKYATSWIGQREREENLIIPGHAHADALEFELHHKGHPISVDAGRVGPYGNYLTYGGYSKATIAHNCVGLGNPWGYDRLDGLYEQHVRQHGPEFLYERSQRNIGRADRELSAFGDVGDLSLISARLRTFENVHQQRTIFWLRHSAITLVHDRLESSESQPWEWYFNPIGKLLASDAGSWTFGDQEARVKLISVLPASSPAQILQCGDPKVPPYYLPLLAEPTVAGQGKSYRVHERWGQFSLFVEPSKGREAEFFHLLIPHEQAARIEQQRLAPRAIRVTAGDDELLAGSQCDSSLLTVDGEMGLVHRVDGALQSYALHHGHGLRGAEGELISARLLDKPWEAHFDSRVTAAVSLVDRRASVSLPDNPWEKHLMMANPRLEEGKETPLPIRVEVRFRTPNTPKRIIALRSTTQMAELDDAPQNRLLAGWENDYHREHLLRESLKFSYDAATNLVTVILDTGIRQIAWE